MAEEIVRIIKVDTKNSGKSIKDLRNEIKSLKSELDKAVVGSEEFESTLRKLTQTQKSYNEVQQQVRDLSRTNQQDLVKFASFARNLGKSYSALNAAVGLFADKNEDVQKAMLKVQRTIQLLQGLDGITGLIRDLPNVVSGFKNWLNELKPIEKIVDRITKGINGISPEKLRQINEANRAGQGSSPTTTTNATISGGRDQIIPAENRELSKQANSIYPALLQQEKDLNKQRKNAVKNLETQKEALLKVEDTYNQVVKVMKLISATGADQDTMVKSFNAEMERLGVNLKLEEASMQNLVGILTDQRSAVKEASQQIEQIDIQINSLNKEIAAAELGMTKFQKVLAKTGVVGRVAIGMIKTALYSIGIGLIIELLVQAYNWIDKIIQKGKEVKRTNEEIAKSTNQTASKGIVVLKELANAYAKVGDTADDKQKFLEKYGDKIRETGLAIDTVEEAEDAFVNNTQKYIKAITDRAKAQATENVAIKLYEEYLNNRYELEQKLQKANEKGRDRRGSKIAKEIDEEDKRINDRMKDLLQQVAELEKSYSGVFAYLETTTKPDPKTDKTDWAKTYKEALEALRRYNQDMLAELADARTKELYENKKAYEEDVKNIEETYKSGVQAAQGNAKKLLEVEEEKNKALHFAQLTYEKRRLEIIDKYNDEAFNKEKDALDREYSELERQLDRRLKLNQAQREKLQNPADFEVQYQTRYRKPKITTVLGLGSGWTSTFQTKEQMEQQYQDQVKYNNEIYRLTKESLEGENEILDKELEKLTKKKELLQEKLNTTDLFDVEKRRELASEIESIDAEITDSTNKQAANRQAIRNAELENERANYEAWDELQEKKRQKILAYVDAVYNASGALSNFFKLESQNEKISQKNRKKALDAYKIFATTQTIIDTWKGAQEAYVAMAGIPVVGPSMGIAAAAIAVATGLANVRAIMNESLSNNAQSASVTAPAPMQTAPIEYTRNLVGDKELDEINQPIRCYVLEQDVTRVQNKVKVTETNATF